MDCNRCGEHKDVQKIPFVAYEAECARHERQIKNLIFVILVCIFALVASNAGWMIAWSEYDYSDYEYTQDGQGINIIGDRNEADLYGAEVEDSAQTP